MMALRETILGGMIPPVPAAATGHDLLFTSEPNRSTGQCGFSEALSNVRTGLTLISGDRS
jgi:hypothetical protein